MINIYEEVEVEDMEYNAGTGVFTSPCPCGDVFEIHINNLLNRSNDIANCEGCGLKVRVIYKIEKLNVKYGVVEEEPQDLLKMEQQAPVAIAA